MKTTLLLTALVVVVGCQDSAADKIATERYEQAIYVMVAANPEDGDGLLRWIDECDWIDTNVLKKIGDLIKQGRIEVTDKGLRAVVR